MRRLGRRLWRLYGQAVAGTSWLVLIAALLGCCIARVGSWVFQVSLAGDVLDFARRYGLLMSIVTVVMGGAILRLGAPSCNLMAYGVQALRIARTVTEHDRRREVLPLLAIVPVVGAVGSFSGLAGYLQATEAALRIESTAREAGLPPAPWGYRWAFAVTIWLGEAALRPLAAGWLVGYIVDLVCWLIGLAGTVHRWLRRWAANHDAPAGLLPSGAGKGGAACSAMSGTGGCGAGRGPGRAVPTHSPGFARAGPGRRSAPIVGAGWAGAVATKVGGGGVLSLRRLHFTPLPAGRR
ncbi:hypothetical protein [Thermaerobacter litoralis]